MSADPTELVREFMRERDVLFGYIFGLTRDHDTTEEVLQDLASAILLESQKGTRPSDFSAWVRTLARHRVADFYRKSSVRHRNEQIFESMADLVDMAFEENEDRLEEGQDRLKHLRGCLERLGSRAREIVDARYRDRMNLPDIAAAFDWKVGSVKVALAKARKALAGCIDGKLAAGGTGLV